VSSGPQVCARQPRRAFRPAEGRVWLDALRRLYFERKHGNPTKAAAAILAALDSDEPPLCPALGADAVEGFAPSTRAAEAAVTADAGASTGAGRPRLSCCGANEAGLKPNGGCVLRVAEYVVRCIATSSSPVCA
jgi:hypothetical protein